MRRIFQPVPAQNIGFNSTEIASMLERPDFSAHSLVSESSNDVMHLRDMLDEAEKAEAIRIAEKTKSWAGEIWEESKHSEQEDAGIGDWIKNIREKDDELKKAAEHARVNNPDKLPPIRNSSNLQPRKVQSGPSTVELEKKSQVKEPTCNKKRLNYSYDYFKEWDKYDVDTELKRLEEEEKHLEEERQKCPKTADPGADVHSDQTYKIEAMTPLEKRVAAQREKEKGNECMKCGETNAAVAYYSKSLELVPGDHLVLGNRAQAYLAIHCYMQAELDCDKALSIEPTYTKARYRRAVARKEQGNWEGSLKDLDIVLIENSAHTQASKLRTECVKRIEAKKKEDEEKRKEEEERQRYESAPRHKIAIQEVEGEDDDDDGMDKTALDQAREAVRLKRDAEDKLLRKEAAQRKKDEGNEAFKKKDLQAAARLYSEAINLYPSDDKDSYVALSNRALVYLQQEKFDEAEIDCNKAIECNPKWAKAWHRRGVARAGLNRRVDALQDLEKALMLEPDSKQTLEEIRKLRGGKKTEASHSDFSFPKGFSNNENKQFSGRPSIVELGSEDYQDNQGDMKSNQRTNVIRESENGDGRPKLQKSHGLGENKFSRVEIIEDEEEDDKANQGHDSADLNISSRMNRIQIIEDDDSDDDDDQKKANVKSAVQVTLNTPADSGLLPAFDGQDEEGEVLDDDCTFTNASGTSVQDGCPIRVCVEEDSDDDMPHDAPNKIDGHTGMVRVDVEEDSDSDDDLTQDDMPTCVEDSAAVPPYDGQQEILSSEREVLKPKQEILCHSSVTDVQNPIQPTAVALWGEGEGRNFEAVQAARGVKEQGDQLMRQGMFEAAAERYSAALDALGDGEDLVQERRVCFSNRAGCRLQLRDYGSVIADCGEVLAVDGCDVKALVRRGLAYEGLEKLSKASADVRAALSIEYATAGAGGRLSNLGQMARQCLERCHRACPQVCPLTIPIQPPVPTQSKVYTSSGQVSGRGLELGKSGVIAEPVKAALEEVPSNTKSSSDLRCNLGSSCKSTVNSVPRKDDQPVSVSSDPEPPSVRERRIEAETLKSKGNEAFESGRYQTAAMYYSGALDLMDNVPAYATNLAASHIMLKNWPLALAAADRSLKMDDINPKAHYRRAQALEGLGRLEEAVEAYQSGLNALPNSEALSKGLRSATERLQARLSATDDAVAQIRKMENERQRRAAEEIKTAAAAAAAANYKNVGSSSTQSMPQAATGKAAITSPPSTKNISSAASISAAGAGTVVPKTGAEFRKTLRSVKRDMTAAMAYLRLVGPTRLVGLLAAGLEEEELVPVLQALDAYTQGADDVTGAATEAFGLLEAVSRAGRVTIACAMLDRRETARLQALLLRLHPSKAGNVPYSVDVWARVRVSFGV